MKRTVFLKINLLILMLALSAGIIFFVCAFTGRVERGVTVNGIEVGGKTYFAAARAVREGIEEELKTKSLTVRGNRGSYTFSYPEITYRDNLQTLLKRAKRGCGYAAEVKYYLNGIDEISKYICADESTPLSEPYAEFNAEGEPFTYFAGNDGVKADRVKLLSDIRASLEGGFEEVFVKTSTIVRKNSLEEVVFDTRLLSSFTTYFDGENSPRVHNIRLAAELINGTVLNNGQSFSFNKTVGGRTAERGFKKAKIIENGEFVEGTGGGVCQVSTTLYNAALLAGCTLTEFHQHSLAVSYVPPSYDAMVSGDYYDLKFENRTGKTLYIRAFTGENYIKFNIYGRGDGAQYDFMSKVVESIAAPVEVTSDLSLVRDGRDGLISEGYLTVTRNGIKNTVLFRRDEYAPVKKIEMNAAPSS